MVFQNIITLIRSIPALIAIIKVIFNLLNSFNKNINLKSLKTFVKNLTLSILLLFLGMFLLMSMLFIIFMLSHILLINDEKITLTLLVVVEVTIVLGSIVFVCKKHLYKTYYLMINYDLTNTEMKNSQIYEEMLVISKEIEELKKNNNQENLKIKLAKLNALYNTKRKLNNITMVYNCLKSFTHTLTYPAIIILYTYFAIEDKLIYTWFFFVAITLLTIGLISMIFFDISKNNSKFKVTKNMLEKHLKRYNKEADKMKPPNLKLLTEKRSFLKRIFYFNKRL